MADVSISALSDRGLLLGVQKEYGSISDVSISALSDRGLLRFIGMFSTVRRRVSISALSDRGLLPARPQYVRDDPNLFQYPLFRIVDCFYVKIDQSTRVSRCFNIRSFGSWIASSVL